MLYSYSYLIDELFDVVVGIGGIQGFSTRWFGAVKDSPQVVGSQLQVPGMLRGPVLGYQQIKRSGVFVK